MRPSLTATVATRVYEPEGAAAAMRLASLVRALERAGYEVSVLTSRVPDGPKSTQLIRRWPVLRDHSGAVRGYAQYASFDIPLFFRLLFGPRADIVIAEPPPTTGVVTRVACWLRRTPYVYYSADVLSSAVAGIGLNRIVVAGVRILERCALRGATRVLAVSEDVRHEVLTLGAPAEKVSVVGTGIDTEVFSPTGAVAQVDYPYFVYAGTMSEVHGASVFLEAFERLSETNSQVRLKMFGSGTELEELKARARALGGRVDFPGQIPARELAVWIRGATASLASVRPGRGYDFAFATKALASLGCGTPVIYAGVGPLNSLIQDNQLGWATPWDPITVVEAMTAALERVPPISAQRLAKWVDANHSMRAVADRAAATITAAIARQVPLG